MKVLHGSIVQLFVVSRLVADGSNEPVAVSETPSNQKETRLVVIGNDRLVAPSFLCIPSKGCVDDKLSDADNYQAVFFVAVGRFLRLPTQTEDEPISCPTKGS